MPFATATGFNPGQSICFEQRFYHAIPYNVCVMKATYRLLEGGRTKLLSPQPPLEAQDVPEFPDREYSSPRYVTDFTPFKPSTDIVLAGRARPPGGHAAPAWIAELAVLPQGGDGTPIVRKRLKLCGPRQWTHRALRGWTLSSAEPTDAVRLAWELAYGGFIGPLEKPERVFEPNPLGVGFAHGRHGTRDKSRSYPAHQIEAIDDPLTDIEQEARPAGFSPLPGYALDRLQYAGSPESVSSGMPSDMDMRFWNCAPLDQRTAKDSYLAGGERFSLTGFWPEGPVGFQLPAWTAYAVSIAADGQRASHPMKLDTVHIDLDRRHLTLRWCVLVPYSIDGVDIERINLIGIPEETVPRIPRPAPGEKPRIRPAPSAP